MPIKKRLKVIHLNLVIAIYFIIRVTYYAFTGK